MYPQKVEVMQRARVVDEALLEIQYQTGPKIRRHKGGIMKCQFCNLPVLSGHHSMNHGTFHARCYFEWINDLKTRR